MRNLQTIILVLITVLFANSCSEPHPYKEKNNDKDQEMIIRIAEIEIDSGSIEKYTSILKEEAEASVRLESGVICIYPMFQKENPSEIKLLEIYASKASYESHLQTPHFKKYKTTTQKMVKSLRLIDLAAIDKETMSEIFKKLSQ